jgi:nucleoside-diphosphate-sugar epimerase
MGFSGITITQDPARARPWEIWHLQSDNAKLFATIPCRPVVSLEEAIKRTVDYFYANDKKWNW